MGWAEERKKISSTKKFVRDVLDLKRKPEQGWYFRGDRLGASNARQLLPSIGREKFHGGAKRQIANREQQLLHRFRRRAYSHSGRALNEWEAMFLARHYNMPSRLLDWTWNPLGALYFALSVSEREWNGGIVWGIRKTPDAGTLDVFGGRGPFDVSSGGQFEFRLIYPVYNSARILAQKGIFSWQSDPTRDVSTFTKKVRRTCHLEIDRLVCWRIEGDEKARSEMAKDLSRLGVSQASLFPDLDGIASDLWHASVLFD